MLPPCLSVELTMFAASASNPRTALFQSWREDLSPLQTSHVGGGKAVESNVVARPDPYPPRKLAHQTRCQNPQHFQTHREARNSTATTVHADYSAEECPLTAAGGGTSSFVQSWITKTKRALDGYRCGRTNMLHKESAQQSIIRSHQA